MTVDTDDATGFLADFANGVSGVFEATRCAPGYGRGKRDYQRLEINGTLGSAIYELQRPFELQVSAGRLLTEDHRWVTLPVPERFLTSFGSRRNPAADEPVVGFRYDLMVGFVQAIREGKLAAPSFLDGVRAQQVVETVLAAVEDRRWLPVPDAPRR